MSSVETGQMSAVETGQMSAAETRQMSAVETTKIYNIETGQTPVSILNICLVSTADICPVTAADICPVSTADICPVSTEDIYPVSTEDIWGQPWAKFRANLGPNLARLWGEVRRCSIVPRPHRQAYDGCLAHARYEAVRTLGYRATWPRRHVHALQTPLYQATL